MLLILSKETAPKGHQFNEDHDIFTFIWQLLRNRICRHYTQTHIVEHGLLLHRFSFSGML